MAGLKTSDRSMQKRIVTFVAMLVALLMVLAPQSVYAAGTAQSNGGTKAYELEGEWKNQPCLLYTSDAADDIALV